MWKYQLFIMASGERSYDVECQNNGENLLNQTQEDMTSNHFQVADARDSPETRQRLARDSPETRQRLARDSPETRQRLARD
jgi:hypothetical protein